MKKPTFFFLILLSVLFPVFLAGQIDSTLIEYIKRGEFKKLDSLLETGINLHTTDENGANALMWACYHTDAKMVKYLFEKGAKTPQNGGIYVNRSKDQWYGDLLAVAAGRGKSGIVSYLIESQKWDVNAQALHTKVDSLSGWTALMHAAHSGNAIIVEQLLREGADLSLKNQSGLKAFELTENIALTEGLKNQDKEKLRKLAEQQDAESKSIQFYLQENALQAIEYAEKALLLAEELYGKNETYYNCMGLLAAFNNYAGFLENALPLYNQSLEYYENNLGKNHTSLGTLLSNLAKCYTDLENYEEAGKIYERTIDIIRKNKPVNKTSLVIRLNGLGYCYRVTKQFEKAQSIHSEALEISKQLIKSDPTDYAESLTHLASLHHDRGELEKALQISGQAVDFSKKSYGEWHSNYGFRLGKHAEILADMGELEEALSLSLKSLEIADSILGKKHRFYGDSQLSLANIYHELNEHEKAASAYEAVLTNVFGIINNNFPYVSEANQLSWRNRFAYRQDVINSFYLQHGKVTASIVNYNTTMKGLTISDRQNFISGAFNQKYQRWLELKKIIGVQISMAKVVQTPMLDSWIKEAGELETILASESKSFANQKKVASIKEIRSRLLPDEAIIDFVHFNYYDIDRKTDSVIYVAYLVRPETNDIELIPLFEEKTLTALVDSSIGQQELVEELYASRGAVKGNRKNRESLLSLIWEPILPYLETYKKLYISPSGLLHKFNLSAIPVGETELMMDRFQIYRFNNLKSIQDQHEKVAVKSFLLVGDVEYDYKKGDETETELLAARGLPKTDVLDLRYKTADSWTALSGTQKEITAIEELLKPNEAIDAVTLKGQHATEENIKARLSEQGSPGLIHFSTHGFFFPDTGFSLEKELAFKASDNPMIRSGLILAGANYAWQYGEIPPGKEDDGILTAYEVANLNLSNTELVVLSACETGLGDIQGSEGVFGLQRAFKMAGTRYILMSLWQVPDEATQKLMSLFYKNWLNGMEVHEALKNAQDKLRSRKSYDHPYFWSGFVLIE